MLKKVKQFSYTMDITITITVTGATVAPLINNNEMMIRFVHIYNTVYIILVTKR